MIGKLYQRLWIFSLMLLLCAKGLMAESYIISPIPPPSQEVLDIDTDSCSQSCLRHLYKKGQIFSFIAKFDTNIKDDELRAQFAQALKDLEIIMPDHLLEKIRDMKKIKIALLVPKDVVGRYSAVGINTILAYLTNHNVAFSFEVFDSRNEEAQNVRQVYESIKQKRFDCVVAMLTSEGVENLIQESSISIPTYIPTVNRKQIKESSIPSQLFFGGIDYEAQISLLASMITHENVVEYSDASAIGSQLALLTSKQNLNIIFQDTITSEKAARFSQEISQQKRSLAGNALLLNIPVIKTGLILPQIGFLKDKPLIFLSTQINYNPSLLMLIKPKDRQNFYVVSAIGKTDDALVEYGLLLGADLQYDWVSYSIGIGTEFLFANRRINRFFSEGLEDSQVKYKNRLYKTYGNGFIPTSKEALEQDLAQQKRIREQNLRSPNP